jgi:predicted component of type VI protein secretion system
MSNPQAVLRTLLGFKEPGRPGRIVVWDTAEVSLGRAPENDVVIEDSDASRQHALLFRSAQGHMLKDLGTSNGTRVNEAPIAGPVLLQNKDVIGIGEVQVTFIQTRKDPASLGLAVVHASELKGFTTPAKGADPGATTLGLSPGETGTFSVGSVGDFALDPVAGPAATRDLDLEFNDHVPAKSPMPAGKTGPALSLTLEIGGLTPDLQRSLQALFGKVIELPSLRVRIKAG